jgi:hypothetical protein
MTDPGSWRRLAAVAVLGVTGACTAPQPKPTPAAAPEIREVRVPVEVVVQVPEVSVEDHAARSFMAYYDRVRQMPAAELSREFARLDPPANPQQVLEMALALGQTHNPGDTVRALALLDPLLKSADPLAAPWQPWARLLAARYGEQRRLEDHVERQNQQLRDAQRRQDQLSQQLEALKTIERSMTTRPAAPASRPPQ